MKYKKHIVSGALALSLLVGGSPVFASSALDLGIKKNEAVYQKHVKNIKDSKVLKNKRKNTVGVVSSVNNAGFILEIKGKSNSISSVDVKTDSSTVYSKNGVTATLSDVFPGEKVIVSGTFDKSANVVIAKQVKIVHNK